MKTQTAPRKILRSKFSVYHAVYSVSQQFYIEIDDKAEFVAAKFHISKSLRIEDVMECFNTLHLDDKFSFDQNIDPITALKTNFLKNQRYRLLFFGGKGRIARFCNINILRKSFPAIPDLTRCGLQSRAQSLDLQFRFRAFLLCVLCAPGFVFLVFNLPLNTKDTKFFTKDTEKG